ncbi:hypothetical protein [Corallococcus llansteffanensis]|uniref:Uncharacterized protein n=1 Tax=Corallococcus llansteffanensis TaxID=2316731 RepID=A0A3A8Q4V3_9BACT|nr:hypothetical protein [Corallococcus llansteffanensis]RKH61980.1 hypothetical protein D7V93_10910 [Corallococcus llansteffanensis]
MPIPVNIYVPQLAIVGNARLRGLDLRALVIDEPWAAALQPGPDVFKGFELEGGFEPSFYVWLDTLKARGLVALRVLTAVDPADWILQAPPPSLPMLPRFVLVFGDREVWYDHRYERLGAPSNASADSFVTVEETRRFVIPSTDAAEQELLEATRGYVRFLEDKVPHDDATAVFYEAMGRKALDLLTDSELRFQERLAARREETLRQRRKDYKPGQGYTKEQRPRVLEQAARSVRLDDFVRVMEEAGLSWRTQRLALASEGLHPLNMRHERTSEDRLPDYVRHPGYLAVGSRLARAAADASNAALNASR